MNQVIYAVVALPFVVLLMLYYAWAASILWGWFIVSFFNVPGLSPWQVVAIMLTLSMFRPKPWHKTPDLSLRQFCVAMALPFVSLGIGAIIKFWILP